jgi:transposase-like protein
VRASLNCVNRKGRKQVAADLKPIYRAAAVAKAEPNLESFVYPTFSACRPAFDSDQEILIL